LSKKDHRRIPKRITTKSAETRLQAPREVITDGEKAAMNRNYSP
jgi:hypothetical protein